MQFLHPSFLWALTLTLIPIIIHFLAFRRYKTVYFSNVRFLQYIKRENQRQSRLKQLLILLCRILAISFIVLAFARPFIPGKLNNNASSQIIGIYLDNSFSMQLASENGTSLEEARQKVVSLIDASSDESQFIICSNNNFNSNRGVLNKQEALQQVSTINSCPYTQTINSAINNIKDNIPEKYVSTPKNLFIFSDFQKNTFSKSSINNDSLTHITLVPVNINTSHNLVIDTCWFDSPTRKMGVKEELFVRIINHSKDTYKDLPLQLHINDTLRVKHPITLLPDTTMEVSLKFKNLSSGNQFLKVSIADYPVTFDNNYYLAFHVKDKLQTLIIADKTKLDHTKKGYYFLETLFNRDETIQAKTVAVNQVPYGQLSNYNTIFITNCHSLSSGLINELQTFVNDGGSLVLFPSPKGDIANYNDLLNTLQVSRIATENKQKLQLANINYKGKLFENVFTEEIKNVKLPTINSSIRYYDQSQYPTETLLQYTNQSPAFMVAALPKGKVYLSTFPLDEEYGNFAKHILFVPIIYNIVLNSSENQIICYQLKQNNSITFTPDKEKTNINDLRLKSLSGELEVRPQIRILPGNEVKLDFINQPDADGTYLLKTEQQDVTPIAFNYSREESTPELLSSSEITSLLQKQQTINVDLMTGSLQSFKEQVTSMNNSLALWKFLLIFALIMLCCEAALIRFWK
ncbi:hypothetical protein EYV94_06405 [Puteibacter caeruleilacunae]|nr:hypothetical protein EYV94_06405 [Puteibacter caeruleilacunae]